MPPRLLVTLPSHVALHPLLLLPTGLLLLLLLLLAPHLTHAGPPPRSHALSLSLACLPSTLSPVQVLHPDGACALTIPKAPTALEPAETLAADDYA